MRAIFGASSSTGDFLVRESSDGSAVIMFNEFETVREKKLKATSDGGFEVAQTGRGTVEYDSLQEAVTDTSECESIAYDVIVAMGLGSWAASGGGASAGGGGDDLFDSSDESDFDC